jgi:hypothetical protein
MESQPDLFTAPPPAALDSFSTKAFEGMTLAEIATLVSPWAASVVAGHRIADDMLARARGEVG